MSLSLRSLDASDFGLLHGWMNAIHLHPFYMTEAIAAEAVATKFRPRLSGDDPVTCVIASEGGQPFGYMQWYLNRSFPGYSPASLGRLNGVSIDYYIGERRFLGRGLGSAMLGALVDRAAADLPPHDRVFYIAHDIANARAIRCTQQAGFADVQRFEEDGKQLALFARRMPVTS